MLAPRSGASFFAAARETARTAENAIREIAAPLLTDLRETELTEREKADIIEICERTDRVPDARKVRQGESSDTELPREIVMKSPYFVPAAAALREFRAKEKAFEKLSGEDEDVRRKATYELSRLRDKVVELNRKHREWKAQYGVKATARTPRDP